MATSPGGDEHGVLAQASARTAPRCDDLGALRAGAHRGGHGVGRGRQARLVDVVAVGVVGVLAGEETHGGADLATAAGLLDAPVLEAQAEAVAVLHEDLGEVTAAAQRPLDGRLQQAGVEGMRRPSGASGRASRGRAAASASSSAVEWSERPARGRRRRRVPAARAARPGRPRGGATRRRPATAPAAAATRATLRAFTAPPPDGERVAQAGAQVEQQQPDGRPRAGAGDGPVAVRLDDGDDAAGDGHDDVLQRRRRRSRRRGGSPRPREGRRRRAVLLVRGAGAAGHDGAGRVDARRPR